MNLEWKYGLLALAAALSSANAQNMAYVVDNATARVLAIDLAAKTIASSIPAGLQPSELLVLPDNQYAFVSNEGDGTVSILDLRTSLNSGTINVGGGAGSLAASGDGRFVWVADDVLNQVAVIDVTSRAVLARVPVGTTPVQVNFDPSEHYAYAVNQADGSISVIDTARNSVIKTLSVGSRPNQIAVLPALNLAYVVNTGSGNLSVIDVIRNEVIGTVAVGQGPVSVAISADSRTLYVVDRDSNSVSFVDAGSHRETARIQVGAQPSAMVVTYDGTYGYVSNTGSGTVSLLNLSTRTSEMEIKVGAAPFSLMLDPDENFLYVANINSGNVSVIDVNTDRVSNTITTGGSPVQFTMLNAPTLLEVTPNPATAGKQIVLNGESFVPGSVVRFTTTAPPRTVSATPALLDSQGLQVTVPSLSGSGGVIVDVLNPDGNSSERIPFSIGTAGLSIWSGGVVEGAGFTPAPISGGSFVSIFGSFPGMTSGLAGAYPLPFAVGNAKVTFNGVPAPIFATAPAASQINALAPVRLLGQSATRVAVTVGSQTSAVEPVAAGPVSPGIFFDLASGIGAFLHADYSPVTASSPAARSETILLYLTGLGNTAPPWRDGEPPPADTLAWTVLKPTVTVGGITSPAAYSGLAPCCSGLYQINFAVPAAVVPGDAVSVSVTIGGRTSNVVKLAVK
jgi:uncharacterized protein (TIGR03437 family)